MPSEEQTGEEETEGNAQLHRAEGVHGQPDGYPTVLTGELGGALAARIES